MTPETPSSQGSPATVKVSPWPAIAVVAFCLFWFSRVGGFNILDPRRIGWMLTGDWQPAFIGWLFVRNGPWTLPLATAPDLLWPWGCSAAFSDAMPIVAELNKALVPEQFRAWQYWGMWVLFCILAHAALGFWVARKRTGDAWVAALAAMFFAVNPIASSRAGHLSLLGQFLIFGLVGTCVMRCESIHGARRLMAVGLGLLFFASGVHAYLAAMSAALAFALALRLALVERWFSAKEGALWLGSVPALVGASFWLFGFVPRAGVQYILDAEGFGSFSADMLTFFNPANWSRFLPEVPVHGRQHEGFAYLGLGGLVLLALALGLAARALIQGARPDARSWKTLGPGLAICLAMFAYALSNHVTFRGSEVLDLSSFYAPLSALTNVFRSSGRFAFPMHHLLLLAGVAAVLLWVKSPVAQKAILAAALALQTADVKVEWIGFRTASGELVPPKHAAWTQANVGYRHLDIHPVMSQWICPYDPNVVSRMSWVAYENHLTINSAHVGRNPVAVREACMKHLAPQQLDAETIYVVHFPEYVPDLLNAGYACGQVDEYRVCVADGKDTPMRRAIDERRILMRR
jgi:hypothetical protein